MVAKTCVVGSLETEDVAIKKKTCGVLTVSIAPKLVDEVYSFFYAFVNAVVIVLELSTRVFQFVSYRYMLCCYVMLHSHLDLAALKCSNSVPDTSFTLTFRDNFGCFTNSGGRGNSSGGDGACKAGCFSINGRCSECRSVDCCCDH